MTTEASVLIQLRISEEADRRMSAARAGLQQTVALVDKGAFVTAAINHYSQHLAEELNKGRDWLDNEPVADPDLVRTLADTRASFRPTVHWARMDRKRQPTNIELHRQLNDATMAVARLRIDNQDGQPSKRRGYRALLRAAGLEIDPTRQEYTDNGHYFLPIRYRQRQGGA